MRSIYAKFGFCLLIALSLQTSQNSYATIENPPFQIGANMNSETIKFAVSEFQDLALKISRRQSAVFQDPLFNKFVTTDIVLISGEKPLKLAKALTEAGIAHLDKMPVNGDGFLIETVKYKNRNILIIASRSDVGALYGLYDYFERYCGAGYFYDGDYLPEKPLVFDNIYRVDDPILIYRGASCWTAHRGLSRNFSNSWDLQHWERYLKWMAKNKLNFLAGYEISQDNHGGDINQLAFPDIYKTLPPGPPEGARIYERSMEWISGWRRDLQSQRKLTQKVFAFGRKLGVKFVNTYDYGKVYPDFVNKYPQYKYMSSLLAPGRDYYHMGETWDSLIPATSECKEYAYTLWKKISDVFGTDGMWRIGWYTEIYSLPGKSIVDMKIQAAQEQADIIKRIEPNGNILIDTWGMENWSADDLGKMWNGLPKNVGTIIFHSWRPSTQWRNFGGHKWILNYFYSFAGDQHPHGDIDLLIKTATDCLNDPKSGPGLIGYVLGSETQDNPLLLQLAAEVAWAPDNFDKDLFLRQYARNRYGDASSDNMYESIKAVSEGMLLQGWNDGSDGRLIRQRFKHYLKESNLNVEKLQKADAAWEKALHYALKEADNQSGNRLYHNYIMELTLQFLESKLTRELVPLCDAYNNFFNTGSARQRDKLRKTVLQHAENTKKLYRHIISLLSTDPDYILKNDIDRLLNETGTNPFTAKEYQRWAILPYCAFQAVECYHDYYLPVFKLCMQEIEQNMTADGKQSPPFNSERYKEKENELWISFFDKPLKAVPDKYTTKDSLKIIRDVFAAYSK